MQTEILQIPPWLSALFVLFLILLCLWLGSVYRRYQLRRGLGELKEGWAALQNAMLTLLGLMLAFTFGMTVSKFESRREIIVEEANDIGTAILRCDLYPDSVRSELRSYFKQYVETRIAYYQAGGNEQKIRATMDEGAKYTAMIWNKVIALSHDPDNPVRSMQMIPAVNAIIDIAGAREAERNAQVPRLIVLTLLLLTITGSFLIGYDRPGTDRSNIFVVGFALMITLTIYLILELDRPRAGLINLHASEKMIEDLLKMLP